jgi:signal transduction histidine kinase
VGAPLEVGGRIRGVLMVASQKRDFFTDEDERFVASVARWVGSIAHRAELVEEISRNSVEQGRRSVAEELVTVLAHDLRNVVAPIGARLQLIRRRAEGDQREADIRDSDAGLRATQRLNGMISDILDVARIDQGLFRLDLEPMDLAAVADDVVKMLSTPEHEVRLAASEEVIVCADPTRIAQCLENLISNAIHHSPRNAPVTVMVGKTRTEEGEIGFINVIDEGPGVPVEILPRLFERFVAGPGSKGLGLGMYLARRIAAAHGGEITVESPPGKGARFRLELPVQNGG